MKRTYISFILGLCCAISMAQPLDSARIVSDWNRLTAYCCAQYELDYLSHIPDSAKFKDARKELGCYTFVAIKQFAPNYVSDLNKKYFSENKEVQSIVSHFEALDAMPDRYMYWDSLFCQFTINDYSSKEKADELCGFLAKEYAQSVVKEKNSTTFSLSTKELIIIACLAVLGLFVLYFLIRLSSYKKEIETLRERVRNISNNSSHRSQASVDNGEKAAIENLKNRVATLESEMRAIREKKYEVREAENRLQVNTQTTGANRANSNQPTAPSISVPTAASIYLKSFNAGIMRECNAADAQYRLTPLNPESTMGEFVFMGDAAAAIATKEATFEDVCDLENWSTSAKICTTIEKGKAEKMDAGKWKVTHKGRIKCN